MDTILENETREIYKAEIITHIQQDEKYITLGPEELDANGREKVRAQMLYDLIQEKRDE